MRREERYRIFTENSESLAPGLELGFPSFVSSPKPCIPSEDHKAGGPPALPGQIGHEPFDQQVLSLLLELLASSSSVGSMRSRVHTDPPLPLG